MSATEPNDEGPSPRHAADRAKEGLRPRDEELRANQARLAEAQRVAQIGSWELDLRTNSLEWSDEIFRIFELDPATFGASYDAFLNAVHPDDRAAVNEAYTSSVATRKPYHFSHRLQMADGRIKHVEERCETHYAGDGTALRSVGTVQDITTQKRAEASLRASEERFRILFEQSAVGIALVDRRTSRIVRINRKYADILGYAPEELIGVALDDLTPPEDLPRDGEREGRLTCGAVSTLATEERRVRKDGTKVWVKRTVSPMAQEADPAGPAYDVVIVEDITARKHAEETMRESERRFRAVFEHSSNAIGLASTSDGRLLDVNRALTELLGYEREELLGKTAAALKVWADPESRRRYAELVQRDGQVSNFEAVLRKKDGELVTVLFSGGTVPIGGSLYDLVTMVDITERKLTERALQLLSAGLVHLSGEAFFAEVARQVARLLEVDIGFVSRLLPSSVPRCRTVGLSVDDQPMPPVDYDLAQTPCEVVIAERRAAVFAEDVQGAFPADAMLADLGAAAFAAVPLFDREGKPIGHIGVLSRAPLRHPERATGLLQLFSVRTGAEIERQASDARFQDLFELAPDAILIVDQEGLITMANRQAEAAFGYRRDELVGLVVERLMPESVRGGHVELRRRFLSATMPRQMGARGSWLLARKKDGTTFPVDIGLSPMQSSDNRRLVMAAIRDVTERVRAEEERGKLAVLLRDARRMEAIGTLAGGIAHDFNNLLAVVVANVEIARGVTAPDHPLATSLEDIGVAAARGTELVRQMLAFSQPQSPERVLMPLGPALHETARMLRVSLPAGVELAVCVDERAPTVLADPSQVQRLLMNLGTNARDALEGRAGRISLELDEALIDEASAPAHPGLRPGLYARIVVSDTGKGMGAATVEHIFEPFFTTKEVGKGSGLGLAVAHGVVHAHGGSITVESRPGSGTTFFVHFPAAKAADVGRVSAAAESREPARSTDPVPHVLFLDDEPALVSSGVRLLERRGYRATGFTRPLEALEALRADPARFAVVVTDFKMPELTGFEIATAVHQLRPPLPVVVMSGHLDLATRAKLESVGVRHMLAKPWSAAELVEILRELTGARSTAEE